ncbi:MULTISPECIES: DUF2971 domain-containing protein [unclassified Burkholderia]|uniref:DUF2971 domain-containing protein n=1 Tax=unclassified Burkholderia TaxID=2613784 RepID=UPI00142463F1|nr:MULTISPECIES: DUF2971 domain-containing protein [unclassified Burkholderia]NIE82633.1 DUF2971 domain-containing protein [Burkholderia sp. Tr-860]NIF61584.1 DUF2971 domain-containing protein [Burkholderia sp. Cy-647]NIF94845.1 DUF2971 domain-containing protein [Burkholderia sp. Ax-1720]
MDAQQPTNSMFLYRFRTVDNLIGERRELHDQYIFFASPDQLNDPLEGHINLHWQGDAIVWRNLFKNYLFCVAFVFGLWSIFKSDRKIGPGDIPVKDPLIAGRHENHDELERDFFGNPTIAAFIDRIINSKHRIGRVELTAHLRSMHYFVVFLIYENFRHHHEMKNPGTTTDISSGTTAELERIESAIKIFDVLEKTLANSPEKIEAEYSNFLSTQEDTDLLNYYANALDLNDANRIFIFNDFCSAYVRQLNTIMHVPWHAACFMEKCDAPSMWAYYGDNHKGICLKYRTEKDEHGPYINLNTIAGWNAQGSFRSMRKHHFKPVIYRAEHATLNFFESLGAVPTPKINAQWYKGENGQISSLLIRDEEGRKAWREKYWEQYLISATTKTKTWEAEQEQRLVLYSMLSDLSAEDRRLDYEFSALEAVIFGVRVTTEQKIAVIRVIEELCRKHGRREFKFFQAYFSSNQNEVKFTEMRVTETILKE